MLVLGWLVLLSLLVHLVGFRLQVYSLFFFKLLIISNVCMSAHFLFLFLVGYTFGIVDLSVIVTMMCKYIMYIGRFRYAHMKYYFSESGRGSLPDVLANSYLYSTIFT